MNDSILILLVLVAACTIFFATNAIIFFFKWRAARQVCRETYAVLGALLSDNQFRTDEVQDLLDNLIDAYPVHSIIPMRTIPK